MKNPLSFCGKEGLEKLREGNQMESYNIQAILRESEKLRKALEHIRDNINSSSKAAIIKVAEIALRR